MMNDGSLQAIEQVRRFLGGGDALFFRALYVGEKCNSPFGDILDDLIRALDNNSKVEL